MKDPEVIEFKLGPRVPCRIVANPPYEVSWYERDTIVEHMGARLTITTKGRLHVKMLSRGYTRAGVQSSEGTGSMWMTTSFTRDKPWPDEEETPVVGGILNDLLEGKIKDEGSEPVVETPKDPEPDPDELILPAPVQSIRDAIDNLGCFDFWMDDDKVAKLVDANAFGKALAPMLVQLGKEADGRWRLTRG